MDLPVPLDHRLILTACNGMRAFRNYPLGLTPGTRPAGWEPQDATELSASRVWLFRCDRITLGPFERGPIQLLFDTHTNAKFPQACREGQAGFTFFSVVANLVLDDADIADHLRATYGAPVQLATFTEDSQDVAAGDLHTSTWTLQGQGTSTLTVLGAKDGSSIPVTSERFFWPNGDGLTMLEMTPEQDGATTNLFGYGMFQPPMLFASDTSGSFEGQGDWYPKQQATGDFTVFSDTMCEAPVA